MANVEHSALTGSNLHESKGVSTASANTVYVADGVGSGSWTTVGLSSLASPAKAFEAQLFYARDTTNGTFTAGSWVKRALGAAITNEISSASIASSVVTLPAGTYWIEATAVAYQVNQHQIRWFNTTAGTTTLPGIPGYSGSADGAQTSSTIRGRFTIGVSSTFELQHRCGTTRATFGLGVDAAFGETAVFGEVAIWKIA